MTPTPIPIHLLGWINDHADELRPPVSNKVMVADDQLIVMVVRGPNARNDFHVDPRAELFYQVEGDIRVDLIDTTGERVTRIVREGELMLVPAYMAHAPMRPAGSWGVVIEQPRADDEIDELVWFCPTCANELHRVSFRLSDIETQLADAIETFNDDLDLRTCSTCGDVCPVPGPFTFDEPADDHR